MSGAGPDNDDQLRAEVLAELARNPRIEGSQIAISVKHGAVTLNGMVVSRDEKICAELAVKVADRVAELDGVTEVVNRIVIRQPSSS